MVKTTTAIFLCCIACCYSSPFNGGFEFYDANDVPIGWDFFNRASSETVLYPDTSSGGGPYNWRIDPWKGLRPFDGERMLTLTTSSNDEVTSSAWQLITVYPGKVIKGVVWFGTCDYVPWLDWFTVLLIPMEGQVGTPEIVVLQYNVKDIGSYGSLGGWLRFQYKFTAEQTGRYYFTILTSDFGDAIYSSQMAADSLAVCDDDTGRTDLNCDCTVNFQDFAILAGDWYVQCDDQYVDCLGGTDIDDSNDVGVGDLMEMAEYWLCGERIWYSRCDFDGDGKVNLFEFAAFAAQYKQANSEHDYDNSGMVDVGDLVIFNEEYLR